jgi:cation transport regulator ChaB
MSLIEKQNLSEKSWIEILKEIFDKGDITFEEILSKLKENDISAPKENEEEINNNLPKRVQKTIPECWQKIYVNDITEKNKEEKNILPERVQEPFPESWKQIIVSARFDN